MSEKPDKLYVVEVVRKAEIAVLACSAEDAEKIAADVYDDDGFIHYDSTEAYAGNELTEKALDDARLMRRFGRDVPYDRSDVSGIKASTPNPRELSVEKLLRARSEEPRLVDTPGFKNTADLFGATA